MTHLIFVYFPHLCLNCSDAYVSHVVGGHDVLRRRREVSGHEIRTDADQRVRSPCIADMSAILIGQILPLFWKLQPLYFHSSSGWVAWRMITRHHWARIRILESLSALLFWSPRRQLLLFWIPLAAFVNVILFKRSRQLLSAKTHSDEPAVGLLSSGKQQTDKVSGQLIRRFRCCTATVKRRGNVLG